MEVTGHELEKVLFVRRWSEDSEVLMVFGFYDTQVSLGFPVHAGRWQKRLDSTEHRWQGNGISLPPEFDAAQEIILSVKPQTAALFERQTEQVP
jgi:maltooligosyltrehalose trehalohydrolase